MKKIISAFAATVVISTLAACTAADDSTISSPRMGKVVVDPGSSQQSGQQGGDNKDKNTKAIEKICDSYTIEQEYPEENAVLYYCRDDGKNYGCISGSCEEVSDYED